MDNNSGTYFTLNEITNEVYSIEKIEIEIDVIDAIFFKSYKEMFPIALPNNRTVDDVKNRFNEYLKLPKNLYLLDTVIDDDSPFLVYYINDKDSTQVFKLLGKYNTFKKSMDAICVDSFLGYGVVILNTFEKRYYGFIRKLM